MIRNSLLETQDSAFEMIAYDFNRVLSGKDRPAEELLRQVERVTPGTLCRRRKRCSLIRFTF